LTRKGINIGLHPVIYVALGTMTACFGGVIRDILCTEIPVIFRGKFMHLYFGRNSFLYPSRI
jgi:uncharacterized membrane protein YeiH